MTKKKPAPVYLNLFRIRFPVGAITSIAHRISGVLLFISLPLLIYLLDLSLRGPDSYRQALDTLQSPWARLGSGILAWSLIHHLLSGIRFLLIDVEAGVTLQRARLSAWAVNILGVVLALAYLGYVL